MKPIKGLWEQITAFENLYTAYRSAAKGKRFRKEVLAFSDNLEASLFDLQRDLLQGTYEVGGYREFYVYEPKKRLVMALPFRDRVAQWAVYQVVNPLFAKKYIEDSYACIDGRGIHAAAKRIRYFAQLVTHQNNGGGYALKLDISKYFYRINHDVLMTMLRRWFADRELLDLLERIIRSAVPFGLPAGASPGEVERIYGVGMPIGNLTSQMFANLYLNDVDQYIKRELRAHCYVRYMDDMVILSGSKQQLHEYRHKIEAFLNESLKLDLNNKTVIRPLTLGIDFCGYRIWDSHIILRKPTALKMRRRLRKLQKDYAAGAVEWPEVKMSLASYNGMLKHCDSYRLTFKIFGGSTKDGTVEGWFVLRREPPKQ